MNKRIDQSVLPMYSFLHGLVSNEDYSAALYIKSSADVEKNKYISDLYVYDVEPTKISSCGSVSNAFWLDETTAVFASKRDANAKKHACHGKEKKEEKASSCGCHTEKEHQDCHCCDEELTLYAKDIAAPSEAERLCSICGKVSDFDALCPERLIYTKQFKITEDDSAALANQENTKAWRLIKRIPFTSNGAGYTYEYLTKLCVFDLAKSEENVIDFKGYSVNAYELSNDKKKALVIASPLLKKKSLYNAIFEYDFASGETKEILKHGMFRVSAAFYLNGKAHFMGTDMVAHGLNTDSKIYRLDSEKQSVIFDQDLAYGNRCASDMKYGASTSHIVRNERLEVIITDGTKNKLIAIDKDGNREDLYEAPNTIDAFAYIAEYDYNDDNEDAGEMNLKLLTTELRETVGQELYLDGEVETKYHDFLQEYYVAAPKAISVQSGNDRIDGFVLLPEDYENTKDIPAVLQIHGGPKAAYFGSYFHEMQMLVAKGYAVFYCNPRGSAGRGDAYSDIYGDYGDIDYKNIMDFTDEVLKEYKHIDEKNLFVTGGSYGGFMTNWIIGMTDRFKAAVTCRSISNWHSMYGVSDIGYYFSPDQLNTKVSASDFWEVSWAASPLKMHQNMKTPTLIIHAYEDYRCPVDQGMQLFTVLCDLGVDTEMLLFQGENHELSRSGKPESRVKRLDAILDWFERYR